MSTRRRPGTSLSAGRNEKGRQRHSRGMECSVEIPCARKAESGRRQRAPSSPVTRDAFHLTPTEGFDRTGAGSGQVCLDTAEARRRRGTAEGLGTQAILRFRGLPRVRGVEHKITHYLQSGSVLISPRHHRTTEFHRDTERIVPVCLCVSVAVLCLCGVEDQIKTAPLNQAELTR